MKILKLENQSLPRIIQFLDKVELKPKASRGSRQLIKRLIEKHEEYQEDLTVIRSDYFQKDEEDNFKEKEGLLLYKDNLTDEQKQEADMRVKELLNEQAEIAFVEHSTKYESLFKALEELDVLLGGEDALAYDELMTSYEDNKKEEK